jgi:hypothetical protein
VIYLVWKRKRDAVKLAGPGGGTSPAESESPPIEIDAQPQGEIPDTTQAAQLPSRHSSATRRTVLVAAVFGILGVLAFGVFSRKAGQSPAIVTVTARPPPRPQAASPLPEAFPAREPQGKPTLAIAPVGIESPAYTPLDASGRPAKGLGKKERATRNAERIRALLEECVAAMPGIDLLARQPGKEGAVPEQAEYILAATLLDLHDELGQFRGYGIQANSFQTDCTLQIRLTRTSDRSITFSKIVTGLSSEYQTAYARGPADTDRDLQAIATALANLDKDGALKTAIQTINSHSAHSP